MGSDNWLRRLSVTIFKQLLGHLSNTQRHRMTIENLILDGQVHTLFMKTKQCQNSIVRDKIVCFLI